MAGFDGAKTHPGLNHEHQCGSQDPLSGGHAGGGRSGAQPDKMVLVEALTYSLTGYVVGCAVGIALQKVMINHFLPRLLAIWKFPHLQIVLILVVLLSMTVVSFISPLRRIKAKGISEVIGSL